MAQQHAPHAPSRKGSQSGGGRAESGPPRLSKGALRVVFGLRIRLFSLISATSAESAPDEVASRGVPGYPLS